MGKESGEGGGGEGSSVDARERHKLAERERRKSMRELFLSLHSLLPNSGTVRKEQSAILDEIINYIPLATSRLRTLRNRQLREGQQRSSSGGALVPEQSSNDDDTNKYSDDSASGGSVLIIHADPKCSSTLNKSPSSSNSSSNVDVNVGATTAAAAAAVKKNKNKNKKTNNWSSGAGSGSSSSSEGSSSTSSVSIRVRGDRVNISLTDTIETSHSVLLSGVLKELDAHHLDLVRSTHCRDGSKLVHYYESKMREDDVQGRSPQVLKERLQDLASKLHHATRRK